MPAEKDHSQASHNQPLSDEDLHQRSLVIDLHADTLQLVVDEHLDLAEGSEKFHLDLPKARRGGLSAQFFSIWVEPKHYPHESGVQRAFRLIEALKEQAKLHSDLMMIVTTPDGIETARANHQLAALIGVEGGHALNGKLDNLKRFYDAGARYMTVTWSNSNELGDSSGDLDNPEVRHHGGLTELGRQAVEMMNRLGMIVDVSHVSDQTFYDVLKATTRPVIASHSCARALCRHARNMTDDMLRALARNGGVVGINFYPLFLDDAFNAHADGRIERVSYQRIVDHIEHVIQVAGVDHVGLGSDFDGIPAVPEGMSSVADLPKLTAELRRRGHSDEDIRKVLGANFVRVFRAVVSGTQPERQPNP